MPIRSTTMNDSASTNTGNEAHRRAQWAAYQKHLAEMEERRALEHSCALAARTLDSVREQLIDALHDRKRAELALNVVYAARQSELRDALRDTLHAIVRDATDAHRAIEQIRAKLNESPCAAIDWTTFDEAFRSAYPYFQSTLVERDPEIGALEMRICALLKLNLRLPDIRTLLCTSIRIIEECRSRYKPAYLTE